MAKGPGPLANGTTACQWHPLNEAADIRMGFWFTLKFKTERFGMAFRLPFTYAFVRPESEHNCSHQRLYWSEPELMDSGFRSFRSTACISDVIGQFLRA